LAGHKRGGAVEGPTRKRTKPKKEEKKKARKGKADVREEGAEKSGRGGNDTKMKKRKGGWYAGKIETAKRRRSR